MLFFDFETFKYDWLVVIMDMDKQEEHVIVNDAEKLESIYNDNKHNLWVGFNVKHYDQYILKAILCGFNPKRVNDFIITKGKPGWQFSSMFRSVPLNIYDVMLSGDRGLKYFEGSMGNNIKETSVPFNIDRKLTEQEIKEVIQYCRHDVEQTIEVFLERSDDFEAHQGLIRLACEGKPLDMSLMSKTQTQLAAIILDASKRSYDDEFDIDLPPCLDISKYTHVVDWYMNPENHCYTKNEKANKLTTSIAGVEHQFGWGGVHGAIPKYHGKGFYLNMDVASLYPSLMIQFGLLSRSMKDSSKYIEIYHTRLEYKASKNPLQAPLKLVLNKTFGAMKDKFNALYDPRQANRVCIYGQLLILDLIEKLEPYCELIQANTDGVLVKLRRYEDYELIDDLAYKWEQRTGLKLEFDEYREIYQKDVNNYIVIAEDGKIKTKGAYIKKLTNLDRGDFPIVNKALVEYMLNGVPVRNTIMSCNDLMDFQYVVKISSKYKHILYGEEVLNERCIRVFASVNQADLGLKKLHVNKNNPDKISNSPEHCFIYNESVSNVTVPRKLDKEWYVNLAEKRLRDFGVV